MNPARIMILILALSAGGVAAYLASGSPPPPQPVQLAPAQLKTAEVLVAAGDIPLGGLVGEREMRWQKWPSDAISAGMVVKQDQPNAVKELTGAIARVALAAGEPIRKDRVVKTEGAGVLSALLPPGSRALAISIDNRGANTAGGFILPNDRVDVIRIYRDEAASRAQAGDVVVSETLLRNVRVLAIGQNIQERNGEKVVVGETATLELDPRQVETISLAQRQGQLYLSLRSLQDSGKTDDPIVRAEDSNLTIVRFGTMSQR